MKVLPGDIVVLRAAGKTQIVVATIAFGMGIDKPNVRAVVHWCLAASVQGYFQEIGRAGRDGAASECVLFFAPEDLNSIRFMIRKGKKNKEKREAMLEEVWNLSVCEHAYARRFPDNLCGTCCVHSTQERMLL